MGEKQKTKSERSAVILLSWICLAAAVIAMVIVGQDNDTSVLSKPSIQAHESTQITAEFDGNQSMNNGESQNTGDSYSQPENTQSHSNKETEDIPADTLEQDFFEEETYHIADESRILLPASLEDGKLEVGSFFQFTGLNPDNELSECQNIAGIQVKNCSDEHLLRAEIIVISSYGGRYEFIITDIPPGRQVLAFSPDDLEVEEEPGCEQISCTAEFTEPVLEEELPFSVSVDGITLTVKNHTDDVLKNITLYCHNPYGEDYFGGQAYVFPVEEIPPHEIVTTEAHACFLGIAEIVRVQWDPES